MADDPEEDRDDEAQEGGPVKTFLEHLEDLRWVLIKSAAALGVAMMLCLIAGNYVVRAIKWPLDRAEVHYPGTNQVVTALYGTNRLGTFTLDAEQQQALSLGTNRFVAVTIETKMVGTNNVLGWRVNDDPAVAETARRLSIELINLSPAGGFIVAFQVAIYAGLVLASPLIFYFVVSFIFPALKRIEKRYVRRGLWVGAGLFLSGVAFCYFALIPITLATSQRYSNWLGFSAMQWRAEEYIGFVCKFMIAMGLGFESPVVILTLVKVGVLDYGMLAVGRRYMIIINLFLAAILTPPDVFTMVVMFVPLQVLYEATVWIAWYWERQEKKRLRAEGLL